MLRNLRSRRSLNDGVPGSSNLVELGNIFREVQRHGNRLTAIESTLAATQRGGLRTELSAQNSTVSRDIGQQPVQVQANPVEEPRAEQGGLNLRLLMVQPCLMTFSFSLNMQIEQRGGPSKRYAQI